MAEWLDTVLNRFGISTGVYTMALWIIQIAVIAYVGWMIGMREKRGDKGKREKSAKKKKT